MFHIIEQRANSDSQLPVTYENVQPETYPQHKDPFILDEEYEYESDDIPEDEYDTFIHSQPPPPPDTNPDSTNPFHITEHQYNPYLQ